MDRWNTFCNAVYCTEYDDDILQTLKECETAREMMTFNSPQLIHRPATVQLIEKVCEQQSYRRATIHLAVYLLDIVMCNHMIAERCLNLVALTCLSLACKIEENESNIPSPGKLNGLLANTYTPADFIALEVTILTYFNWHITIPTAATFLDVFDLYCFDQEDYNEMPRDLQTEQTSVQQFTKDINETSDAILKNTLQNLSFCNIKPSLLAAACVGAARLNVRNVNPWNERLTKATGYEFSQIYPVCQMLLLETLPQSQSTASSCSTPMRSVVSDAGYLSELLETDADDNLRSSGVSSSTITSEDTDSATSSPGVETDEDDNLYSSGESSSTITNGDSDSATSSPGVETGEDANIYSSGQSSSTITSEVTDSATNSPNLDESNGSKRPNNDSGICSGDTEERYAKKRKTSTADLDSN